jgi:hypothetical protein
VVVSLAARADAFKQCDRAVVAGVAVGADAVYVVLGEQQ